MGSNMAENHPVGFRWPMKAKERGATLIHVDPRFSRTSAVADLYVPIRPGSDIAFLGGLINYVLTHDKWFKEYVLAYTNASALVSDDYVDAEDPGRRGPAVTARQYRTPGRRHHGDARPRIQPGIDRRGDPLRPPARLPAAPGGFQG